MFSVRTRRSGAADCVHLHQFRTNRAVIWLACGASQVTIEHERAHGRGYDRQTGELRSQYAAWTNSGGKRIAPPIERAYRAEARLTQVSELRSVTATE